MRLKIGADEQVRELPSQAAEAKFDSIRLAPGRYRVVATVERGQKRAGANYIDLFARDIPPSGQ